MTPNSSIPELIDSLDISGAVITSDAMGCQTTIVKKIIAKQADYVIGLKGNQQTLHDEVANYFEQAHSIEFDGVPVSRYHSKDQGHGRFEERIIYATDDIEWLSRREEWAGLTSIVMVDSKRRIGEQVSSEIRYYISSLKPDPESLAAAIRTHWGIENQVHWVLDVTFQEDTSQISTGNAAENLSILRRLSLNPLRADSDSKTSLRAKRKKAGWDNAYLAKILRSTSVNSF